MNLRAKVLVVAAICAAGGTFLGKARAGRKEVFNVWVYPAGMEASGSLGDVRNSTDSTQYFGCETYAWVGYSPEMACYGSDTSGNTFYCSSSNAGLAQAASFIKGDSYVWVTWNSSGQCTYLQVDNSSEYTPKAP